MQIDTLIKLTPEQEEMLEGFEKLLFGPFRSGRTTIMAIAYTKMLISHPKIKMKFIDHNCNTNRRDQLRLISMICDLLEHNEYDYTIDMINVNIMCTGKMKRK